MVCRGVAKSLRVACEDRHLHIRIFAAQRCHHGQPIPAGHTDIRKQNMRVQRPDELRPLLRIAGRTYHLAVVIRPPDHPAQTLHDDIFIIDQQYPVHFYPSYPFNRMADSTASAGVICPVTTF